MLWKFQTKENYVFNRSSDIGFQAVINFYKKCTAKPYSFLVIDTLPSDNFLHFRKNLLERITTDDKIGDEKLQYDINREAANISALSSGNINNELVWNMNYEIWIDKYEYLTGEEIKQTS